MIRSDLFCYWNKLITKPTYRTFQIIFLEGSRSTLNILNWIDCFVEMKKKIERINSECRYVAHATADNLTSHLIRLFFRPGSVCPKDCHSQLTTVSPLCHGEGLVNDIRLKLKKTWDPCRISRKLEIVVVSDVGSYWGASWVQLIGCACFQSPSSERFWSKHKPRLSQR